MELDWILNQAALYVPHKFKMVTVGIIVDQDIDDIDNWSDF